MSDPQRLHPIAAITGLLSASKELLLPIVLVLFFGREDSYFMWFLLGSISVPFLISLGKWLRFTYQLDGTTLIVHDGILVRKKMTIPKNRVQSVDISAGILQRLFGLVSVQIRTAAQDENATINLSAVHKDSAKQIAEALRGGSTIAEDTIEEKPPVPQIYQLDINNLFKAGLTSGKIGVILSIVATVLAQFDNLIDMDKVMETWGKWAPFLADSILALIVVTILATWAFSILGTILTYYDFRLFSEEKQLVARYGLLSQRQVSIPYRRIQAIRFVEGVLRQPFGYGSLYVESAGEGDDKMSSFIVAPFIHRDDVEALITSIQPELVTHADWQTPPARARLRYILRLARIAAILCIPVVIFVPYGWISLFLILIAALLGETQFRTAAFKIDGKIMTFRTRSISRNTVIFNRSRVQSFRFSSNWFLHRKDLWSFQVTLASLNKGLIFGISFLGKEQQPTFHQWVNEEIDVQNEPANVFTDIFRKEEIRLLKQDQVPQ